MNKKVGKGLASAIETGEKATQTTKETIGTLQDLVIPSKCLNICGSFLGSTMKETKGKAEHASDVASQKANQVCCNPLLCFRQRINSRMPRRLPVLVKPKKT
jgi:hypothetical protein